MSILQFLISIYDTLEEFLGLNEEPCDDEDESNSV